LRQRRLGELAAAAKGRARDLNDRFHGRVRRQATCGDIFDRTHGGCHTIHLYADRFGYDLHDGSVVFLFRY
jgi:hypothetical protein